MPEALLKEQCKLCTGRGLFRVWRGHGQEMGLACAKHLANLVTATLADRYCHGQVVVEDVKRRGY